MKRRELLQQVAAVVAANGLPLSAPTVLAATPASVPVLAVFETSGLVSHDGAAQIRRVWEDIVKGTPFEHVRAIVLDEGLRLTLLDQHGHALNADDGDVEVEE